MNSQLEMMKKAIDDASHEKGVQWNKVTWYSWVLALIVFFVVIPATAFYLGTEYGALRTERGQSPAISMSDVLLPHDNVTTTNTTTSAVPKVIPKKTSPASGSATAGTMTTNASGRPEIRGTVMMGPMCTKAENKGQQSCNNQPYQKSLEIYKTDDTFVKSIAVSIYGTFQTELTPGTYVIRLPKNSVLYPRIVTEKPFTVAQGKTTEMSIVLDTGIR